MKLEANIQTPAGKPQRLNIPLISYAYSKLRVQRFAALPATVQHNVLEHARTHVAPLHLALAGVADLPGAKPLKTRICCSVAAKRPNRECMVTATTQAPINPSEFTNRPMESNS